MENTYFKDESPKKGIGYILALAGMLIFSIMGIGIDIDEYLQHLDKDVVIPQWYFFLIFAVDILIIVSIVLMFFYKKIGVLLFPVATLSHFLFHLYFLDTFLYSDVTALFMFAVSLLAIIPKWQFFK